MHDEQPLSDLLARRYWGAHVLMVLAVATAAALGLWQLDAWQSRRDAAQRDLTDARPVPLSRALGPDQPFPGDRLGQPVQLAGTWLPTSTVFVSGRERAGERGRDGYWVVTPVRVTDTGSAMPVVRGWSARPEAPAVAGNVALTGWLQAGEGSGIPDRDPSDDVLPELRIASLVQRVPVDLYGGYVVAQQPDSGLAAVLPADVPPVSSTTALRNLLYAIEWWVFGGFAVVVWWRWCRGGWESGDPESGPAEEDEDEVRGRVAPGTVEA